MSRDRQSMLRALREAIVPELRAAGFGGTLPHLRRLNAQKTDVIAVQFSRGGGKFVLELAEGPAAPFQTADGRTLQPAAFTSYDMPLPSRARPGPSGGTEADGWFSFAGAAPRRFTEAAERARTLLPQAFLYWSGARSQPNIRRFHEALEREKAP